MHVSVPFDAALFLQALVTVVVVMDPFGNVPVFLSMTRSYSPGRRRRAAGQASLVAAGVILAFALFGQGILRVLGISLTSLQVAGGLLLVLIALELLRPWESGAEPAGGGAAPGPGEANIALVPLGTPLLAGPGAIAATMLYMQRAGSVAGALSVVLALVVAVAVVYLFLRYSALLARVLKANGISVLSRVMGLLVAAIAVQLVATAVEQWVRHGVT
ncbi:MAG TPA: MarC family protein [Acidimicrobiales bacterium]|jgi:multiple antibiotic resistance protein|nr:MarC family protein [Acidimicrobiales bacterium]